MARKSNASVTSAPAPASVEKVDDSGDVANGLNIDDLSLPRSMVQRLAKGVLPANTQIQKDALLALHRSATVFVNYLASHANENTLKTGKKTIQPSDVFEALRQTEFEPFLPRLEAEYSKFASIQTDKRNSYRKKVKEEKLAAAAKFANENTVPSSPSQTRTADTNGHSDAAGRSVDSPPAAKKARRDDDAVDGTDAEDDVDMPDDAIDEDEDDQDEPEDDEAEDEGDEEEEAKEDLVEDPIEVVEKKRDDESDGDDSD